MAKHSVSRTKFFDCSASFGVALVPPLKYAETAEELLKEMDFCGVQEALVWDAAMKDDSPAVGNQGGEATTDFPRRTVFSPRRR